MSFPSVFDLFRGSGGDDARSGGGDPRSGGGDTVAAEVPRPGDAHLHSGWAVDRAIVAEDEWLVMIRFSHDWDEPCLQMDETLAGMAEKIRNFAVICPWRLILQEID